MDHDAEVCGGVCGRDEVYNDLDVGSHNEKCQWEWTMMPRFVLMCVGGVRSVVI